MTAQATCPQCGLEQQYWSENEGLGYAVDNDTYCCEGCAEGAGCTCTPARTRRGRYA